MYYLQIELIIVLFVKDTYDGVVTNFRSCGDLTSNFSIIIELHQGSTLSSAIVMDEFASVIQNEIA